MKRPVLSSDSIWTRAGASGIVIGLFVGLVVSTFASFTPPTASADNSSAVTVTAAANDPFVATSPFPDLSVTVSKTADLISQGIVVSWTGGKKSVRPQGAIGGENFLQIAQCWGEDPQNPGHPDRTTCQYGAFPSGGRDSNVDDNTADNPNNIAPQDERYTAKGTSFFDPSYTSIPFRAVTGETVASVVADANGVNKKHPEIDVNTNQFFTAYTSNEVKWAGSDDTGTGSVKFEVQTSMQSTALGCGQPIIATGKSTTGQACWLVVIPRGTGDSGQSYITKPGLFWDAWKHNIAFKLDFKPVGIRCEIGSAEQQLSGSELITAAISSWQPNLCQGTTGSAFVLSTGSESDALAVASLRTPSPLALTSRPLQTSSADPLAYAPLALSGVAISFSIDRRVVPVGTVPQEYKDRDTLAFASLNLTPRLVAKLLTDSYIEALPPGADRTDIGYVNVDNPGPNPRNLTLDPDFLAINDPEWASQDLTSPSLADLLSPTGRSDLANQLWRYVADDADAASFLAGTPDPWGMKVNPWYSTSVGVNKSGTALALPRDNFPKADPLEKPATSGSNGSGPVNLVTWRPYTSDFEQGAYLTLRGDGLTLGAWDSTATPPKYGKSQRSLVGEQKVLGITTTASAERYQTVTASLRNPAGRFVAPTSSSMLAAASAMTPTAKQAKVLEFDPAGSTAKAASTAYPLTMPVYAALNPQQTDTKMRAVYANLIRYAATDGQILGTEIGQLPVGYAPIPASWVSQALAAATAIQDGVSQIVAPSAAPVGTTNVAAPVVQYAKPATPVSATAAVASASAAVADAEPTASGVAAGVLVGKPTPPDPVIGPIPAAIPAGLLSGLLAAGGVPLISRIRSRS